MRAHETIKHGSPLPRSPCAPLTPRLYPCTRADPFNVEPPLPKLMEQGFITPAALHYVRNHGAVPKIKWEEHRLSVGGCVDKPTVFTMDDLLAMPARELPITLVCAGNRRKEENLVKQTVRAGRPRL